MHNYERFALWLAGVSPTFGRWLMLFIFKRLSHDKKLILLREAKRMAQENAARNAVDES